MTAEVESVPKESPAQAVDDRQKLYLEFPLKVTSQKVYPAKGKGTVVRIQDIQHVSAVVPPKRRYKIQAAVLLAIGVALILTGSKTPIIFGAAALFCSLVTFSGQAKWSHSWVKLSTASGPIIWNFDDEKHAPMVRDAVQKAISDSVS